MVCASASAAAGDSTPVRRMPTSSSTSAWAVTPRAASSRASGSATSAESSATVRSVVAATPAIRRHFSAPKLG